MLCQAQLPAEKDWKKRLGTVNPQKAEKLFEEIFSDSSSPLTKNTSAPISYELYLKVKQLIALAPYSDYFYYSGDLCEKPYSMYPRMLDSIADPAIKMMLVEDVVELGKRFVDDLDSINVLRELNTSTKGDPLTMPLAKIRRAHYNYLFAHNPEYYPAHLYDKLKAYELYREAFKEFLAAKGNQGKELHAYYVQEYYKVCQDLYQSDEEKYYEQFLADYQEIVQVCDKLLVPYYDVPDTVKTNPQNEEYSLFRQYNAATYGCELQPRDTIIRGQFIESIDTIPTGVKLLFAASGAASADRLRTYYAPRLEANRQNKEYLDHSIRFMFDNGFTMDTVVYNYCKASYEIGKTYENCIGLATSAYIGLIDKTEMRSYYTDALQVASSDALKAKIRFWIARSLYTTRPKYVALDENGDTVMVKKEVRGSDGFVSIKDVPKYENYSKNTPEYQQWENDIFACNTNLELMLKASADLLKDPSLDVRDYVAQAYYMMGENHYWLAAVNASLDDAEMSVINFQKAAQLNIKASQISGRAVNASERIIGAKGIKQKIKEAKAKAKKDDAKTKAYEEYMRKKKAEEDFWKQGH